MIKITSITYHGGVIRIWIICPYCGNETVMEYPCQCKDGHRCHICDRALKLLGKI